MSDMRFCGSIVAVLPVPEGEGISQYVKETFHADMDEDDYEYEFTSGDLKGLHIDGVDDKWIIRDILLDYRSCDGSLVVHLDKILAFKELISKYVGELKDTDISVQAHEWYDCCEEPLEL